jgi:hypothetical protein
MNQIADPAAIVADFERKILKDKLRFAIGKPAEGHSGVWSAWNTQSEFYLGARGTLGNTKISLHKSGRCRFALTEEAARAVDPRALPAQNDRAFVKWNRPPAPAQGAHLAVLLCFPTDYLLLPAPAGSAKKPVLIFEAARSGKATQIGFFFSRESAVTLEQKFLKIGKPILHWDLPNGEAIWLVARESDFDATVIPDSSAWSRSMRVLDPAAVPAPGMEQKNLNAILWNAPSDGDPLQIIEIGGLTIRRNA